MQVPKQYFQDRLALALSSASLLVVIITSAILLSRLGGSGSSFIASYRANLGIEAFQSGGLTSVIGFVIFTIVVFVLQTLLAWRVYLIERRLAISILAAGLFLIFLNLVVGSALLALH